MSSAHRALREQLDRAREQRAIEMLRTSGSYGYSSLRRPSRAERAEAWALRNGFRLAIAAELLCGALLVAVSLPASAGSAALGGGFVGFALAAGLVELRRSRR